MTTELATQTAPLKVHSFLLGVPPPALPLVKVATADEVKHELAEARRVASVATDAIERATRGMFGFSPGWSRRVLMKRGREAVFDTWLGGIFGGAVSAFVVGMTASFIRPDLALPVAAGVFGTGVAIAALVNGVGEFAKLAHGFQGRRQLQTRDVERLLAPLKCEEKFSQVVAIEQIVELQRRLERGTSITYEAGALIHAFVTAIPLAERQTIERLQPLMDIAEVVDNPAELDHWHVDRLQFSIERLPPQVRAGLTDEIVSAVRNSSRPKSVRAVRSLDMLAARVARSIPSPEVRS